MRGRLRGTARRPLPAILTKPCAAPAPARSRERCLISTKAAALPCGGWPRFARPARAPRGRLGRPGPPSSGGGAPRGAAGGEVRARRAIPLAEKLQYPAGRGARRRAVPARRLRKPALRRPRKARGTVGRPRFASLGSQGARGRSGLFPLRFSSRRAGRGFEINPARARRREAARPAQSEPGAGEKGQPAPRAQNMPAGGRRRGQGRPPGVRRAQRLPPPQPQGTRLLCQRCRRGPQEEPGTPEEDHVSGNGLRFGAGRSPAGSGSQPRAECQSSAQMFQRSPAPLENKSGEKKGAVLMKRVSNG